MGLQVVQIGKCGNIHPTALFLPLTEPGLFHPLAGWKEEGLRPSPVGFGAYFERKGPFEELSPGGHPIMPNTLPLLSSSLVVVLSTSKVCARIAKETGISRPCYLQFGELIRAGRLPLYRNILNSKRGWRGRSQDGGGIGRGDHFLFYKFIERTTER